MLGRHEQPVANAFLREENRALREQLGGRRLRFTDDASRRRQNPEGRGNPEPAVTLAAHVDCVVGMGGSIPDDAARHFAVGFYGGLGARQSVAAACEQGRAAISLEGLRDSDRPQLKVRDGVDASQIILAADAS